MISGFPISGDPISGLPTVAAVAGPELNSAAEQVGSVPVWAARSLPAVNTFKVV